MFLELGFRPFFLCAAVFSIVSMAAWMGILGLGWRPGPAGVPPSVWHAHEMLYGYAMVVIAGFLLTAVRNWTGIATLNGYSLAGLAGLWLVARLFWLGPGLPLLLIAVVDNLFILLLIISLAIPIVRARNWRQIPVLSKIVLLLFSNVLFYLGVPGIVQEGKAWGIYSALYLIVSLILMIGRRVIPFFITKGVGYTVEVKNRSWVDWSSVVLSVAFWFFATFMGLDIFSAILALGLFVILAVRLRDWHTPGIWKKPLLWILYLAHAFIALGFLLFFLAYIPGITPYLAVHAFAAGGIGMMTVGMMARVALGHTGRSIHELPALLPLILFLSAAAALVRVIFPLLFPAYEIHWIVGSQVLWIVTFVLFTWTYFPILVSPRITHE